MTNNGQLIAGIVQRPTLLPCQYIDASGNGQISDALSCFNWLASKRVQVISCSWGTTVGGTALQQAVMRLSNAGILISTSAGNNGVNTDNSPQYPSAYSGTMSSVLAAAALDTTGGIWSRSNYGNQTVQLAAPGVNVIGLGLGSTTRPDTGSSMVSILSSIRMDTLPRDVVLIVLCKLFPEEDSWCTFKLTILQNELAKAENTVHKSLLLLKIIEVRVRQLVINMRSGSANDGNM